MHKPSLIHNRKHIRQVCDFRGLRWGSIYPTDIDGLLDFGARAFVLLETKHTGGSLSLGQRLAMERLVDKLEQGGVVALGLVAEHDTDGDIDCANCIVTKARWHRRWVEERRGLTVRSAIDGFLRTIGLVEYLSTPVEEPGDLPW